MHLEMRTSGSEALQKRFEVFQTACPACKTGLVDYFFMHLVD